MASGSPSPPPVPDASATANAQGQANTSTAAAQAALNYVNQNTPYGSTSYAQTGSYTDPNGQTVPTYTQDTSLNPLAQQILSGTQGAYASLMPAGQTLAGQAGGAVTTPLDFNTPYSSTLAQGPQLLNQNTANAIYGEQKGFLDPQWQQQGQALQDQLSRQGIPVGSDAYSNAMTQFNNSKTQAYQAAQDSAVAGGTAAAGNLFNMALQGQQQNLGQQQLGQQNQLGLLQTLFGMTSGTPQQPIATPSQTQVSPTDVVGATGLSTSAAQNAYQAQLAQQNSMFGGLAGLGSAGILAVAL